MSISKIIIINLPHYFAFRSASAGKRAEIEPWAVVIELSFQ